RVYSCGRCADLSTGPCQPHSCSRRRVRDFFFLIRRRPPSSTLFPYTTLFRSRSASGSATLASSMISANFSTTLATNASVANVVRSEEHTSELQSLTNLVCRLLLEKKKESDPFRTCEFRDVVGNCTKRQQDHHA